MGNDFYIRLLVKKNGRIEDMGESIYLDDFGGHLPAIGDRFVQMLKGENDGYRVVDRIFDTGHRSRAMSIILERISMSDIDHIPRFDASR